jgi:hypothetical protein
MKKSLLAVLAVAALAFAPMVSAQADIQALGNALNTFAEKTPGSLGMAAGAGIDWSNAYIGQLIDTDFPFVHLGVGASVGITTIPKAAIGPLLEALNISKSDAAPLPYVVANARVGGLILPFDLGVKVGVLPAAMKKTGAYDFDYQNLGADFRLNLVKSDILLPDVSVGGGVNYVKYQVGVTVGDNLAPNPLPEDPTKTMGLSAPHLGLTMDAMDFEVKAQVSKTIFYLLTPYLGATVGFGTGTAKAMIETSPIWGGNATVADQPAFEKYTGPISSFGFGKSKSSAIFNIKAYGGASLNILIIKLDLQGMYNVLDGSIGGSVGLRAQL